MISGYLTTSIILKSLNNGTFTFSEFYTRRIWRLQPAVIALLVATLIVTTLLYLPDDYAASDRHEGWPNRFDEGYTNLFNGLKAAVPVSREGCLGVSDGADRGCLMGSPQAAQQVLLMGDSFSNHYWGFVETLATDANLSVLVQGYPACLALPGIYLYNWNKYKNALYQKCHDAAQRYYAMIAKKDFQYVILGQFWEAYLTDAIVTKLDDPRSYELSQQRLGVAIREALNIIVKSGATPVFLENTLPMPAGINECLLKEVKLRGLMGSAEQSRLCATAPWAGDKDPALKKLFNELMAEYPTLIIIDPKSTQCKDGTCMTMVDGLPVYRDIGHVTDYASYRFGEMYLKRYGNPLKARP